MVLPPPLRHALVRNSFIFIFSTISSQLSSRLTLGSQLSRSRRSERWDDFLLYHGQLVGASGPAVKSICRDSHLHISTRQSLHSASHSMSASYQCIASSLRLRQSPRFQGDGGGDFRAGTNHQRQRARPQHRPPATVRRSMRERRSSYKTGSSSNFSPPPVTWIPSPQSSNDHGLWHTNSAISCAARLGSSESAAAVLVVGIEFTWACASSGESPRAT